MDIIRRCLGAAILTGVALAPCVWPNESSSGSNVSLQELGGISGLTERCCRTGINKCNAGAGFGSESSAPCLPELGNPCNCMYTNPEDDASKCYEMVGDPRENDGCENTTYTAACTILQIDGCYQLRDGTCTDAGGPWTIQCPLGTCGCSRWETPYWVGYYKACDASTSNRCNP